MDTAREGKGREGDEPGRRQAATDERRKTERGKVKEGLK